MKTLILSNFSPKIAELNAITAPNKRAYADRHGYDFENVEWDYSKQVEWLNLVGDRFEKYAFVLTIGCDAIFTNQAIRVESRVKSPRVTLAREHISWWPINNDVAIWPAGAICRCAVIEMLIRDSPLWLTYPWLWQAHLWDLMQSEMRDAVNVVEAREMNSTWREGLSKWQFGDWILHALDCPLQKKIEVIKAYLPFVTANGLYSELPKSITGRK